MNTLFLTGAPGALASVIRETFLANGWKVAGFGRIEDTAKHEFYKFYRTDVTNEHAVEVAFEDASADVGSPTAIIATVGGVRSWKSVAETTVEDFEALFEMNLLSYFLTAKHGWKHLLDGGRIISIGADSVLHPSPNRGAYVAAKAGVMSLTKVLAKEGRTRGITANCIVPTVIRTAANEEWGSAEDISKWTTPEEIAAMCVFLCGESGSSVTGSLIEMPGRL